MAAPRGERHGRKWARFGNLNAKTFMQTKHKDQRKYGRLVGNAVCRAVWSRCVVCVCKMDMEAIITYAGPLTFLGLQCSTLSTGYQIWTNKSVFHYSIIPFFTLFVNCVVWGIYGYLIDEFPIYG
jgi:hypothetical protein